MRRRHGTHGRVHTDLLNTMKRPVSCVGRTDSLLWHSDRSARAEHHREQASSVRRPRRVTPAIQATPPPPCEEVAQRPELCLEFTTGATCGSIHGSSHLDLRSVAGTMKHDAGHVQMRMTNVGWPLRGRCTDRPYRAHQRIARCVLRPSSRAARPPAPRRRARAERQRATDWLHAWRERIPTKSGHGSLT